MTVPNRTGQQPQSLEPMQGVKQRAVTTAGCARRMLLALGPTPAQRVPCVAKKVQNSPYGVREWQAAMPKKCPSSLSDSSNRECHSLREFVSSFLLGQASPGERKD